MPPHGQGIVKGETAMANEPRPAPSGERQPEPVPTKFEEATLEQVARAIFAGAKHPEPSKRRD